MKAEPHPDRRGTASDQETSADSTGPPRRRWRRALIAGGLVLVAVPVAFGAAKLIIEWRDRTDPVDVDQVARDSTTRAQDRYPLPDWRWESGPT